MFGQNIKQVLSQPTPCEKYGCVHVEKCKAERLSCASFNFYARTGRAVFTRAMHGLEYKVLKENSTAPSKEAFLRLYQEDAE